MTFGWITDQSSGRDYQSCIRLCDQRSIAFLWIEKVQFLLYVSRSVEMERVTAQELLCAQTPAYLVSSNDISLASALPSVYLRVMR